MPKRDDQPRDLWSRLRNLGRKMESEIYDFTEEDAESEAEARGRNTLIALINSFFTIWKANEASSAERTLGLAGFGGLAWLLLVDRGIGFKKTPLRVLAGAFAVIWFVPGLIASAWMLFANLGASNLKYWRSWPLLAVYAMSGLIGFRGLFSELARQELRPLPEREPSEKRAA
ncbi:MAG: hypothetical protein AAB092_00365 [Chloroflexota bacterium]|jgi:hypothetical protein